MIRKFIATIALAGTVVIGASSGAFAADPPKDPVAAAEKRAEKCAKAPEVIAHIKANQEKRADRLVKLEAAKSTAAAAGETEKVVKIEGRIAKVKDKSAKAAERLTKLETKFAEKCAVSPTP